MAKKEKVKKVKDLRFRDYFGTTTMSAVDALGAALMTSWFMLYLTDYAGIGKWGAILGSALLLFSRLFDAINDPLEGWIMDRAKVGKHGKYKPFILISIICTAIGVCCMFSLPTAISGSPVMICTWVIFFYLMYDIGVSFYAPNLVYRTLTLEQTSRSKLVIGPRLVNMIIGMVTGSLMAIVTGVNASVGNMHDAFGLTVVIMMAAVGVVALIGALTVKEKYHAAKENDEEVKITDIFKVLKHNKAQRVWVLSSIFSGLIWTFLFATTLYYIKWAYCADLTTGAVDAARYGMLSLIGSMMMFLPIILGTAIATPLVKLCGSAMKLYRILKLIEGAAGGLIFVCHILGLLSASPVLFFVLLAIIAICIGIEFIPEETIRMECMDYELYVGGKDRAALCNASNKFINKAQAALASGIVGLVLVGIGYSVDSATDTYTGSLEALPQLMTWFIVIMGLIPCILAVVSYVILGKYPVDDEIRGKMKEQLTK